MDVDLSVKFADINLENPLIVASGPLTSTIEKIRLAEKYGAAGISTKMAIIKPMSTRMRAWLTSKSLISPSDERLILEKAVLLTKQAKKTTDLVIISNILGDTLESWKSLAVAMEKAGADILELNLSCPNIPQEKGSDKLLLGQDSISTMVVTREVVDNVSIPVICKLTPLTDDIVAIAKACKKGGADGVTAVNAMPAAPPIDIFNQGRPVFPGLTTHSFGGMTGYWLKPISLRCVALIAQETEIPVAGCGGIYEWKDAAEMIMWGANCFQVNTSLILKGFHQIERIISGLEGFMEKMGYQSLSDFQGLALNHLTLPTEVTYTDITFIVDENLCDACGACNRFGHCTAITIDDVARINQKKCLNCGLCMQICPKKAITAHYH